MRYSIVTFSGNVLPAVWDVESETEEGALQEAMAMYSSRVSVVPGLIIDWDEKHVKRIVISILSNSVQTLDNAGELFGISTTAEHFEQIAEARDAEEMKIQQDMEQEANGD